MREGKQERDPELWQQGAQSHRRLEAHVPALGNEQPLCASVSSSADCRRWNIPQRAVVRINGVMYRQDILALGKLSINVGAAGHSLSGLL